MNNQNKQFEDNIYRLLKANRESNMPTEKFTNDLTNDVLNELNTDQDRRQKRRKTTKFKKLHPLEIAALLLLCGGFLFMVFINLGQQFESKFQSLSSDIEDLRAPSDQSELQNNEAIESIEPNGMP